MKQSDTTYLKGFGKSFFSTVALVYILLFASCLKDDINVAEGIPSDQMSILDIRALHKGNDIVLNKDNMFGASKMTGVVITDHTAGNIPANYVIVQQTSRMRTRGIVINLAQDAANYKLGDSLVFNVNGASLVRRNGVLQIIGLNTTDIEKKAEQIFYQPLQITLAELNKNFSNYEATLIKVTHVDATQAGSVIAGDREIVDIPKQKSTLHVEATASFANKVLPINATYTGIPLWDNKTGDDTANALKQIWVRNLQDIGDESGALYDDFPEYFELDDPALAGSGYSGTKTMNLVSGTYLITNGFLGAEANDRAVSGKYAVRFNQNSTSDSWCTMNSDLRFGASKITVWAGSYGASADLGSTWRLEYSQDGGNIWYQIGQDILTTSKDKKQYTFLTNIKGPVRFRIGKVGIGTSTTANQNGRFSMDDFAVYKNPEDDGTGVIVMPTYVPLISWQFGTPATGGNEVTSNANFKTNGIVGGVLSRGPGLGASSLARAFASLANAKLTNGNDAVVTSTKALALAQNVYYQVEFDIEQGKSFSLTAIDVYLRRSGAGAKSHTWYYSLDNGEFKPTGAGSIYYDGSETDGVKAQTNYFHNTTDLQNIPGGTNVKLRMYAWGFTNVNSGTFSIGRTAAGTTTPSLLIGGKIL